MKNVLFGILMCVLITEIGASVPHDSTFKKSSFKDHFLFSAAYKFPVNSNIIINSGHGLSIEAGLTASDKFRTKFGVYAGWAFQDYLWKTAFNNSFAEQFNHEVYNNDLVSVADSGLVGRMANLVRHAKGNAPISPGCATESFHNYSKYIGLLLKMPGQFSPVFKLYVGSTSTYIMTNQTLLRSQDYNIFELRRTIYGCEMTMIKALRKDSRNNFGLSFYYENSDFENASIVYNDGSTQKKMRLKKFMSQSFMKKYKNEFNVGIKLSYLFL